MSDIIDLATRPKRLTFNYDALEPTLATDARAIANRIRSRLKQGYLATGHDLIDMKGRLGHGRFGAWITAEFGMTARTAERYMGAANFETANFDMMSEMPAETLQALAAPSIPDAVRAICVERMKAGIPVLPRDVRECAADTRMRKGSEELKKRGLPRGKAARAAAIEVIETQERNRQEHETRAMQVRLHLVDLIVDALGERAPEALHLIRQIPKYYIDRELLEALERREVNA